MIKRTFNPERVKFQDAYDGLRDGKVAKSASRGRDSGNQGRGNEGNRRQGGARIILTNSRDRAKKRLDAFEKIKTKENEIAKIQRQIMGDQETPTII